MHSCIILSLGSSYNYIENYPLAKDSDITRCARMSDRVIFLRIDNLPPGKTWKQVKYLIGGIIHHSNVVKVKMLPLMSSIVPPFIPFQSCVVSLRGGLDGSSLNELLVSLNTFQWDYYNLYAYTLPQPMDMGTSGEDRRRYLGHFSQGFQPSVPELKSALADGLGAGNSRRLRQIFNERSFRKQMTGRGMWQLQLDNFPPFLKLDTMETLTPEDDEALREKGVPELEIEQPDKFGRLRWTVLKDFIKLKCPKLLNLEDKSMDGTENNTREFYVGVYEDAEEQVRLKISGESRIVKSTVYKAIVGFNDKELCDLCLESLQDQEYSLGYRLKVRHLPPYDERNNGITENNNNNNNE